MCRTIDAVHRSLPQHYRLPCNGYWAHGRVGSAVSHVIVARAGIVDRPHEIVFPIALEDVCALAECIVVEGTATRGDNLYAVVSILVISLLSLATAMKPLPQ